MSEPTTPRDPERTKATELEPLRFTTRVLLLIVGWLLVLVGLAGLVLPGLQGVLTLFLGAAVLSLVSERVLRLLRWLLRPWPKAWRRTLRLRRRVHGWLRRH